MSSVPLEKQCLQIPPQENSLTISIHWPNIIVIKVERISSIPQYSTSNQSGQTVSCWGNQRTKNYFISGNHCLLATSYYLLLCKKRRISWPISGSLWPCRGCRRFMANIFSFFSFRSFFLYFIFLFLFFIVASSCASVVGFVRFDRGFDARM